MPPLTDSPNEPTEEARNSAHPSLVLGAYADEIVAGSRVAVFGDATLELPFELLERGARIVHVYDLDPTRLAEATAQGHERSLYFGSLRHHGDIGVRDGAFDVAFVPDLSFTPDPEDLIRLIRRVLSSLGAAVIASPNPDVRHPFGATSTGPGKLGYYELYESISRHFPRVRMLGQVPFVGYAMAEFSADASSELEPTIDSSLIDEEREPEWFVALASSRGLRLESYQLVEVPWTDESRAVATPEASTPASARLDLDQFARERNEAKATFERERNEAKATFERERNEAKAAFERERNEAKAALERERNEAKAALERERNEAKAAFEREREARALFEREREARAAIERERNEAKAAFERERDARASLERERNEARTTLERRAKAWEQEARTLEQEAKARELEQARANRADQRTIELEQQAVLLREQARQLEERLASEEKRSGALSSENDALRQNPELDRLRERNVQLESQLASIAREQEQDVSRLESQLRDRGREIAELRAELLRRERLVREMLGSGLPSPVKDEAAPSDGPVGNAPGADVVQEKSGVAAPIATGPEPSSGLRVQLDVLAREVSRREADLVAAGWKIAQLERQLEQLQR